MSEGILNVTDDGFEADVVKSDLPTLVDFWAEWCGPCRALTPVIEELAKTYKGKVQVCKVNIDEHPGTAGKYEVRAIPTLLLFKQGEVVEQMVGLVSKAKLAEALDKHI